MDQQQFVTNLQDMLKQLVLANDTQTIQNVTKVLGSQFYTHAQCVPALFEIATTSDQWQVRQLAAVEMRKKIAKYWDELGEDIRQAIRDRIASVIISEPNHLARHGLARVVSSMAKLDLPANKWPTLLPFIYECCNHAETVRREVGVYVLDSLFETIADQMAENIPQLLELFSRLLRDPESHQVRVATVRALGQVAELIDTDDKQNIAAFQSLVPDMGQVLEQSLERGDEDSASSCFEVFNTLLLFETPLLSRHFSELIGFAVKVGCNTEMDDNLRIMALNFLVWAATYKRSRLLKLNLVQSLIEQLMPITTEEDPADADDESPSRVALRVLNVLSTSLPPQQVFPTAIRLILQYMDSQNPMHRKGAMLALAITVEGCVDFIRSQVSDLVQLITRGMHDQDVRVRRAACLALGCIADEMDQDIAQHHSTLLPIIFELLNESETDIIKHACNALDAIVEGLSDEQIAPYMPSLMEKLVVLLDNGPMEVRPMALAAIGSAAHAAGTQFLPYFDAIIGRTKQAMSLTASASSDSGNSLTSLRGVATDTAATLAEAVGKEKFQPHLADTVKLALEGMSLDSPNLRDCGFCFFGVLSRVFSDEFGDFLPYIVPEVLKTFATEDIPSSAAALDLDGEDGDDEDDDSDDFQVSTAIADEKEVAADCVAELYRNTRSSFVPYVESITTQLLGLLDHYSDTTRKAAVAALFSFLKVTSSMAQDPHWESGKPLKVPVHQNVETMIKTIVPAILKMWEEEDDKMVVAQICTELRSTMQLVGPAVVLNDIEKVCMHLKEILEKKALCQLEEVDEVGEPLDTDELAEYDSLLIGAAADCVAEIADVLGSDFLPIFDVFLDLILGYYKPSNAVSERSTAIGCLSEITNNLDAAITKYTNVLFSLFMDGLASKDAEVRSNAAYGVGVLVEHSTEDASSHYTGILKALYPLLESSNESNQADNACGAIARLIRKNPTAVPLSQLLPVWLKYLPLKSDHQEDLVIYDTLSFLLQNYLDEVKPFREILANIFRAALSNEETLMSEEARAYITSL